MAHGSVTSAPIVRRVALLSRLEAVRPRLVVLIAPAGFGKSTLIRQYLQGQERAAVCDCAHVADELDFARRLIPALADEHPERSATLTQRELMLGDGNAPSGERLALALNAWRAPSDRSTFVFENAEYLSMCAPAREFLARLLANIPEGRSVAICSRESLRMHLSRFAAPHEIITLRAADLTFDRKELREIFPAPDFDEATIERVQAVSQGWPIAVFLLARFASEGRLGALLDKLDDVAFEELHEYLTDQVLDTLPPEHADVIFACAVIPNATERDVALALDQSTVGELLSDLEKNSPFVTRTAGKSYIVHPLVASLLLERHAGRRDALLAKVAEAHAATENFQRAAELHLAHGDQAAAALALNKIEVIEESAPSMRYARVLSSIDRSLALQFARLWGATSLLRLWLTDTTVLLREAEAFWQRLPPDTPPVERFYIFFMRPLFMSYIGMFGEAEKLIDDFARATGVPDVPQTRFHGWVFYFRFLVQARTGRLAAAERNAELIWPLVSNMDVMASGTLVTLGADVARVRGERERERDLIERATEYVRRSEQKNFIAFDLAEATLGAWLAGEDGAYARYAAELAAIVEAEGVQAFAFFSACTRGTVDRSPTDIDLLKWIASGHLVACGDATTIEAAEQHARAAVAAARTFQSPFTYVLALLALANFASGERTQLLATAVEVAASTDSTPLQAAVGKIVADEAEFGMLDAFVKRRLQRDRTVQNPILEVELVTGRVRIGTTEVPLPDRELGLLFAIARRPDASTRGELADLLWPDLEEQAARNAFNVCIHRLRAHLGPQAWISRTSDGYRMRDDVRVDLWEIDRAIAGLRKRDVLVDADYDAFRVVSARLNGERPGRVASWEWFAPIERRIRELRCEVAQRLAERSLQRGDYAAALALAHEMIAHDPCDEPAREIAIRALLGAGDDAGALRHFRQYRETLKAELDCEPSAELTALIGTKPALR